MHVLLVTLWAGILGLLAKWITSLFRKRQHLYPPGPKPLPIIGNMFDMPTEKPWITYEKWCKEYGSDLIYLDHSMQPTIIIGSLKASRDLLEKKSQIHSDRQTPVFAEMLGWDFSFGFHHYGPRWRAHRRSFSQHFNPKASEKFRPTQIQEIRKFLVWTADSPEETRVNIRRMTVAIIAGVVYGMKISGPNDPYIMAARNAMKGLNTITWPGSFWLEFFPFLRHLPSWVPFNAPGKMQKEFRPKTMALLEQPYDTVKKNAVNGTAAQCVALTLVEQLQSRSKDMTAAEIAEEEDTAKNVAAVAYVGGADTTASACEWFLLAMALFPEVQKRAQDELDRVVGPDRLPEFEDINALPYIRATLMEVMRWMPALPLGTPHKSTADDVYNGYTIPKGSLLVPNLWGMLHDPEVYPEPDRFAPDRFIGSDGQIDPNVLDPGMIAFGFGRRICPGNSFSDSTIIMTIAHLLHVFNITPGKDESGQPIKLAAEGSSSITTSPAALPRSFTPRSQKAANLVREVKAGVEGGH